MNIQDSKIRSAFFKRNACICRTIDTMNIKTLAIEVLDQYFTNFSLVVHHK